jgi:thiamine biosynthesis protein ThiS
MTIYLNGEPREVPENLTLSQLLEWLKLPADRVAVERNREIASRSTWAETLIQPDDRLEVVHFVGGGIEAGVRRQEPEFRSRWLEAGNSNLDRSK